MQPAFLTWTDNFPLTDLGGRFFLSELSSYTTPTIYLNIILLDCPPPPARFRRGNRNLVIRTSMGGPNTCVNGTDRTRIFL